MLLYRIHLNPRSKDARRDLADPYQMHATLCRAFFPEETRCPPGGLLWRLEPETDQAGRPRVLIQSPIGSDWSRIPSDWLAPAQSDEDTPVSQGIDLAQKLALDSLVIGQTFRFRLRANPSKSVGGKRLGLMNPDAQMQWLQRKGTQHGFALVEPTSTDYFDFMTQPSGHTYHNCRITQEQMLRGHQHGGNAIHVYAVLYEGQMSVADPALFRHALEQGIGHAKMMGLGLLSVVPVHG